VVGGGISDIPPRCPPFYQSTYITVTPCPRWGVGGISEIPPRFPRLTKVRKYMHTFIHSYIHTQQLTPCPRWGVGGISVIPPKFPRFTKVTKYMHTYVRSFIHTYTTNSHAFTPMGCRRHFRNSSEMPSFYQSTYIAVTVCLRTEGVTEASHECSSETPSFYQNDLAMRNTADVTDRW
jgi:hypothetical protein